MRALRAASIVVVVLAAAVAWRTATRPRRAPDVPTSTHLTPPVWTPVTQQTLNHGRFQRLVVYSPHGSPRGMVLLLSGPDGWTLRMSRMALELASQGAMVVGIAGPDLDASLETDGAACVFPDGDLENLSHFVQAYYRLPAYLRPILAGYATGGTLAYAMLAQAPADTFAAAVSLDFCQSYPLKKRLCKGSGLTFSAHGHGDGVDFLPSAGIANPWIVLQSQAPALTPVGPTPLSTAASPCDAAAVARFVNAVPHAKLIMTGTAPETPVYAATFDALLAHYAPASTPAAAPGALDDLPLVAIPAQAVATPPDTFALMLSGDGGWAGLDKDVAAALAADGIPVVGLDSLRYFWSARTPQGLAADLARIIQTYQVQFGRQRVLLVGYSQGADVLPFAVNRLSPATRSQVALTAVMGMSEHALFEFHMTSWMTDDNSGPATLPEVERIAGMAVLCIYGEEETDSLCPKLDPRKVTVVKLKGGHHFDGNYAALARTILDSSTH